MKTSIRSKGLLLTTISILLCAGCTPLSVTTISTRVASPINTLTPPPTLMPGEQENYVRELLKTNAGCRLPCWWGVTPGKTSWQDAKYFLRYLGASVRTIEYNTGIIVHGPIFEGNLSGDRYSFYERSEIVDAIFVRGNDGSTKNQRDFESLWESYSPKQVLRTYGVPSRVLLSASGVTGLGDSGNNGYILWIFFDHMGFMVRYDGVVADLPIYHFCPELKVGADNIDRIDFTLQYPDHALPLEWGDAVLTTQLSRTKSIQDATGMSLEEFHQLFSQDDKPACFDTPHDIWSKN